MDIEEIKQIILTILRVILKQSFEGSIEVTRENTPSWDSLKHIEIIFAVEDELGVRLSEEDLSGLDSVDKIAKVIKSKYAA